MTNGGDTGNVELAETEAERSHPVVLGALEGDRNDRGDAAA